MSSDKEKNLEAQGPLNLKPKQCWGARHTYAIMAFLATAASYIMRMNLSVTIVAIAKKEDDCLFFGMVETFVEDNHLEELEMSKSTLEEIKDIIMGL